MVMIRDGGGSTSSTRMEIQVVTDTVDKKIATNCGDCHGTERMHGSYPFEPNFCKACHDYGVKPAGGGSGPGGIYDGWTNSNCGFGAASLDRRVHRVHRGKYLEKTSPRDFSHIVFPQDIRNCSKCHSDSTSNNEKPSRLACISCHESDAATAHGILMTVDPTPLEPWSGDELESCGTCHGPGKDFAVYKVHNITDPYVPPYPR